MFKDILQTNKGADYDQETINILRLIRSENVGTKTFFTLIKIFGNSKTALENIADFSKRGGRTKPIKIFTEQEAEKELKKLEKAGAKLITYLSKDYSQLLLQIHNPPPILTYKGNIKLLNSDKCLAIVGARNASINGKMLAKKFAEELTQQGYIIVSGLARGIDTAAHQAAQNQTIGVMAGGIDYIYPAENAKLYNDMSDNALLIAELPIGSEPLQQNFPQRNRIISGLSLATLVVEAGLKSGSLITALNALNQNREVFAVPGFPLDPRAQGTNNLIKQGAYLVENIDDIVNNLPNISKLVQDREDDFLNFSPKFLEITEDMRLNLLNCLSNTAVTVEQILEETQLSLQIIYTILLELELAGKISRGHDNKITLNF